MPAPGTVLGMEETLGRMGLFRIRFSQPKIHDVQLGGGIATPLVDRGLEDDIDHAPGGEGLSQVTPIPCDGPDGA